MRIKMDMTLLTGVGVQKAETSDKPLVSVVVAAYNASVLLKRALISLQTQSLDASLYEVIVIDDGSVDNTPHVLRDFCESAPNFRWYSQSNQGPARARNVGIRRTKGAYVAITDQDCQADRYWLQTICDVFTSEPDVLGIEGKTVSFPERITPFTHQIVNLHGGVFATCNVAYRKSVLDEFSGFDEDFPYGHEDTDLSLRVRQKGRMVFSEKTIIIHPPIPMTFKKVVTHSRHWRNEFILFKKQPDLYRCHHKSPLYTVLVGLCLVRFLQELRTNLVHLPHKPFLYLKFVFAMLLQRIYFLALLPGYLSKYK